MNAMTHLPDTISNIGLPKIDTYDARELVKSGTQACIVLDDQTYYLRITRAGKLILTK